MEKVADLEKLVDEIEDYDSDSIKDELKAFGGITLQIGFFGYDESQEEPSFIFDEDNIIDELGCIDECYEKYKSDGDAEYGIYLDMDLNVELNMGIC